MQKWMKALWKFTILLLLFGVFMADQRVEAAGEQGHFGSESYEWKLGALSDIGVYASADGDIGSVEMYVAYDKEMLAYETGGELTEDGLVKVAASSVNATEYKQMLRFVPRMSGDTKVTIQDIRITNANGEEVEAADVSVPVHVTLETGCALEGIQVNGKAIPDFVPEKTDYSMEAGADVSKAEIHVSPETIQTEISDTTLSAGGNIIYIITSNAGGQKARYTLHINKPEQAAGETEQEAEIQSEPTVIMEKDDRANMMNQILMGILIAMLFVILAMLLVIKWQITQRNKRKRRRMKALAQKAPDVDIHLLTMADEVKESEEMGMVTESSEEADYEDERFADEELEIAVKNVTMEFKREKDESTSIKELIIRTIKKQRSYELFKALDDVSFNIRKGEVVGIIGTNGSGKSTILKIISGALAPTKGSVDVDRKKIQLLTLGTGFDFELTGRENVYLNGAVIGYTKEYIDEKYDDIVKFAELEGFMEEKVRNYSSGMVSRLGFAIATIGDAPEILILDEVLSVGDMFFRKKSEARIKELIHGGSTVLIVSHSPSVIKGNCTKAVWIEKGKLRMVGEPKEVCAAYEKMNESKE